MESFESCLIFRKNKVLSIFWTLAIYGDFSKNFLCLEYGILHCFVLTKFEIADQKLFYCTNQSFRLKVLSNEKRGGVNGTGTYQYRY